MNGPLTLVVFVLGLGVGCPAGYVLATRRPLFPARPEPRTVKAATAPAPWAPPADRPSAPAGPGLFGRARRTETTPGHGPTGPVAAGRPTVTAVVEEPVATSTDTARPAAPGPAAGDRPSSAPMTPGPAPVPTADRQVVPAPGPAGPGPEDRRAAPTVPPLLADPPVPVVPTAVPAGAAHPTGPYPAPGPVAAAAVPTPRPDERVARAEPYPPQPAGRPSGEAIVTAVRPVAPPAEPRPAAVAPAGAMIRPPHLGGPASAARREPRPSFDAPAAIAEVARIPRRRRDDFLPDHETAAPAPLPQADLPPGFTDPITGLPLAEAMRADIELRAVDFKTFTVVVCHPMMAMTTPGGAVNASPNAPFGQEEVRVFAGVLRDTLRQRDIVGRYDERLFLLFLPRCKVDEVLIPIRRIRANLLAAQRGRPQWVDITFGAAAGRIGESVDGPLRTAYADLLRRNAGPAWFLED